MLVRIRLFAQLRERAGVDWIEAELPEGATVADALAELGRRPPLDELVARLPVRMAVNRELAALDTPLRAQDERALVPPVSGGSGPHVYVSDQPIDPVKVTDLVLRSGAGAIVTFEGTVRSRRHRCAR
jgi:molybdopterin synthase catalytic subunit